MSPRSVRRETDTQAGEDARTDRARANRLADADIALAPVREVRRATRHTATIGGRALAYTATAGALTVRNDEGKPTASMFYVAYTAGGGAPDPHRPVTFFYNGGPGSSTLWLHMGSLGPVRVTTDSPQATAGPPFRYGNNPDSLLDTSDLVFLDAIGTGFSRPLGETKLDAFWGTDPDIDAFARGIERYLTANGRWNSPKFIFGESYGTTRSAGLSYRLAQDGAPAERSGAALLHPQLRAARPGIRPRAGQLHPDLCGHRRLPPPPSPPSPTTPTCARRASGRTAPTPTPCPRGRRCPTPSASRSPSR